MGEKEVHDGDVGFTGGQNIKDTCNSQHSVSASTVCLAIPASKWGGECDGQLIKVRYEGSE